MKLIGAGLPRTATLSQKVALEILGVGPCYHMVNMLGDLDEVPKWRQALEGEKPLQEVLEGFESTVDWPGAYFYKQLLDLYPDAKLLLSVRDGEAWERSMRDTIWGVLYADILIRDMSHARAKVDPKWQAYIDLMGDMWRGMGVLEPDIPFGGLAAAMERYNQEVRRTVPADRLLVWTVSDGWEPLCGFLDMPVPSMPFPHLNDSKQFIERVVDGSLLALQAWRSANVAPAPARQAAAHDG